MLLPNTSQYDAAEIEHASLDKTVITTKMLLSSFGPVETVLSQAITPPPPHRIKLSLEDLYKYGAITSSRDDAKITRIGRAAVLLPLELPQVCRQPQRSVMHRRVAHEGIKVTHTHTYFRAGAMVRWRHL